MADALQSIESQFGALTPAEKVHALRILALQVADVWPGIERTPDVAGGSACIVRTRVPVWTLEAYRRAGWSEALIMSNYPMLRAADLVGAWAYAESHQDEIQRDIDANANA